MASSPNTGELFARAARRSRSTYPSNPLRRRLPPLPGRPQFQGGMSVWLAQHKPALSDRLILMSAVAQSNGADGKNARNGSRILQKPFKAIDLLTAVDELLSSSAHSAPPK